MIRKYLSKTAHCIAVLSALLASLVMPACNANDEDTPEVDNYMASQSVAVTNFSLMADVRVMRNLDSVFFSIDLEHGVIFNADSLPKGTNVTKLIPKISYPSSVTSAVIEMTGGSHREGTVNYLKNSTDTIDFTGDVTLTLSTANNAISKTYRLKVNVHKEDPDTLFWDRLASSKLPSRLPSPKYQKSVPFGDGVLCFIQEADESYTIATTSDIFEGNWEKKESRPDFKPQIYTLQVSPLGDLFVLSDQNELFSSHDGLTWSLLSSDQWSGLIGFYGDTLLGISLKSMDVAYMKSWPDETFPEMVLPEGFPFRDFSNAIEFSNRWTPNPTIIIFGGSPSARAGFSSAWAFDGSHWAEISEQALPELSGFSVVKYYSYLNSASSGLLKEFEVYLAFGGTYADGTSNNTVYISYDRGINWQRAQNYMQLPASIQTGKFVNALSLGTAMKSNLSDRWQAKRALHYEIDGEYVIWDCPYIFLFGGIDNSSGTLNNEIRSGVLQRLTFTPLF